MLLPDKFTAKMKKLLGSEYDAYQASLDQPANSALRINTSKISTADFLKISPFDLEAVPWSANGFYYDPDKCRPSSHPFYNCGLYYLQEASAMAPASFLPVRAGDRVLDLCAAPGGKTTQLALNIQKEGLLVSNDISASRCKALLKNIEVFGLQNTVVTCETPARLAEYFPVFFDKILIDAPCSGEGMFRKGERMISAWEEHGPDFFEPVQKEIFSEALKMLKPGGMILYSTCTFDPSEDEGVIDHILKEHDELSLRELPMYEGFVRGFPEYAPYCGEEIRMTRRLFPHRIKGDGHFAALLQKEGTLSENHSEKEDRITEQLIGKGKKAHLMRIRVPALLPELKGIRFIRSGLLMGEVKNDQLIPSQAYAMSLKKDDFKQSLKLTLEDERTMRYLKGESLQITPLDHLPDKGDILILIEGFPAGWGKIAGNRIKNKLLAGWRIQA